MTRRTRPVQQPLTDEYLLVHDGRVSGELVYAMARSTTSLRVVTAEQAGPDEAVALAGQALPVVLRRTGAEAPQVVLDAARIDSLPTRLADLLGTMAEVLRRPALPRRHLRVA